MQFVQIPKESFATAIADSGAPQEITGLLNYLFDTVLDGRNAYLSDGVQRALGRAPTDFADYTHRTAASGVWDLSAQTRFAPLVAAIALSGRPRTASASTPMRAGVRRAESGSSGSVVYAAPLPVSRRLGAYARQTAPLARSERVFSEHHFDLYVFDARDLLRHPFQGVHQIGFL